MRGSYRGLMRWIVLLLPLAAGVVVTGCREELTLTAPSRAHRWDMERFVPNEMSFWSASRGVALDRSGRAMETTADGGRHWHLVKRWSRPVTSVSVSAGGVAAALSNCRPTGCDRLWRSTDAGRSWSPTELRPAVSSLTLARSDPTVAWARLDEQESRRMQLEATNNAGRTWRAVRPPCAPGWTDVSPVSVSTLRRAWIMCTSTPGVGQQEKQLFRTADGGATWMRLVDIHMVSHRPEEPGGISSFGYPSGLSMTGDGVGTLTEDRGVSYRTSDGGRHWHPLRSITAPDTREGLSASQVSDSTALILVFSGDSGTTLYRSTDGDRHWTTVQRWPPR
jgi:photosystem II stability/assembly factor-like uncharacterized protein